MFKRKRRKKENIYTIVYIKRKKKKRKRETQSPGGKEPHPGTPDIPASRVFLLTILKNSPAPPGNPRTVQVETPSRPGATIPPKSLRNAPSLHADSGDDTQSHRGRESRLKLKLQGRDNLNLRQRQNFRFPPRQIFIFSGFLCIFAKRNGLDQRRCRSPPKGTTWT